MATSSPNSSAPDALAKLAEIPPVGSEERDFWLMAPEQHGFLVPAADGESWLATDDTILALMSEARKQGQRDVLDALATGCAVNMWERTGGKKLARGSKDPASEYDWEWRNISTGELRYCQPYYDPNGPGFAPPDYFETGGA